MRGGVLRERVKGNNSSTLGRERERERERVTNRIFGVNGFEFYEVF